MAPETVFLSIVILGVVAVALGLAAIVCWHRPFGAVPGWPASIGLGAAAVALFAAAGETAFTTSLAS